MTTVYSASLRGERFQFSVHMRILHPVLYTAVNQLGFVVMFGLWILGTKSFTSIQRFDYSDEAATLTSLTVV